MKVSGFGAFCLKRGPQRVAKDVQNPALRSPRDPHGSSEDTSGPSQGPLSALQGSPRVPQAPLSESQGSFSSSQGPLRQLQCSLSASRGSFSEPQGPFSTRQRITRAHQGPFHGVPIMLSSQRPRACETLSNESRIMFQISSADSVIG